MARRALQRLRYFGAGQGVLLIGGCVGPVWFDIETDPSGAMVTVPLFSTLLSIVTILDFNEPHSPVTSVVITPRDLSAASALSCSGDKLLWPTPAHPASNKRSAAGIHFKFFMARDLWECVAIKAGSGGVGAWLFTFFAG